VIIHLFRPEVRSFYNIEKIWAVDSPHRTQAAGQVV
jgi:ribosome-associated protein